MSTSTVVGAVTPAGRCPRSPCAGRTARAASGEQPLRRLPRPGDARGAQPRTCGKSSIARRCMSHQSRKLKTPVVRIAVTRSVPRSPTSSATLGRPCSMCSLSHSTTGLPGSLAIQRSRRRRSAIAASGPAGPMMITRPPGAVTRFISSTTACRSAAGMCSSVSTAIAALTLESPSGSRAPDSVRASCSMAVLPAPCRSSAPGSTPMTGRLVQAGDSRAPAADFADRQVDRR